LEVLLLVRREEVDDLEVLLLERREVLRDEEENLDVLVDEYLEEEDGVGVGLEDDDTLGRGVVRLAIEDALLLADEAVAELLEDAESEGVLV
jgi:hypothetical protein